MAKLNELKLIRLALELNQGEMAVALGFKSQSYYSELEGDTAKPAAKAALEKAKAVYKEMEGEEWTFGVSAVAEAAPPYVTGALPEHISEAWAILHEATRAAGADLMAMDVGAVGEMLGAAAEAVAAGRGEEARMRAVRRAETILRAMGKGRP